MLTGCFRVCCRWKHIIIWNTNCIFVNCLPKRFILTLFVFEMGPEAHSDMFTHKLYTYITPLSSSGPFICICLPIIQLSWSEGIESFTCYVCLFVFPNNFPWINQHLIDSNDINALRSIFKNGRTNYCTLFTFHWTIYSFDFIVFSWCVCVCFNFDLDEFVMKCC